MDVYIPFYVKLNLGLNFWIIFPKNYIFLIYDWLFESLRNECNIIEYSIQETSLEQIFNQFTARQGKSDTQEIEAKTEIHWWWIIKHFINWII